MIIKKTKIRNISKIIDIIECEKFKFQAKTADMDLLENIGFCKMITNEEIVPNVIGPVTRFNAMGKEEIKKPKEIEFVYHDVPYHICDRYGNSHYGICSKKYKRYKRCKVPATLERLVLDNITTENDYVVSSVILTKESENERVKTIINLFLEIFGYVTIVDEENKPILKQKRIPWEILPPGKYPWPQFASKLDSKLKRNSDDELKQIKERYEFIENLNPKNIFSGKCGFLGYYIAEFNNDTYVCDSIFLGNAIYILGSDWTTVSQLTKKEIIEGNLCVARIIHSSNWKTQLLHYLGKKPS